MRAKQYTAASLPDPPRRRRGRPSYDSSQTRESLLNAAEELFARFGVEGVSMRSINAAAGVSPPVAHYHFSSKERLAEAVVRRRGDPLTARTFELLDALERSKRVPTPKAVAKAIAIPFLELLQHDPVGGLRWTQIIGRLELTQDPRLLKVSTGAGSIDERFWHFVHAAFPRVPHQILNRAWRIMFRILLIMLGNSDPGVAHHTHLNRTTISADYVDSLVDFVASGFAVIANSKRPPRKRS